MDHFFTYLYTVKKLQWGAKLAIFCELQQFISL